MTGDLLSRDLWEQHERQLKHSLFAEPHALVASSSYREFVEFMLKFVSFREERARRTKSAAVQSKGTCGDAGSSKLPPSIKLPPTFDQRYTLNFTVLTERQVLQQELIRDQEKHKRSCAKQVQLKHREVAVSGAGSGQLATDPQKLRRLSMLNRSHQANVRELGEGPLADLLFIVRLFSAFRQKRHLTQLQELLQGRASLPIASYESRIVDAVARFPVVVIAGDTGCGKSTQVPQYLLRAGYRNIACTQPRRISAMALARRVSYETLNEYGSEVAYQIRFDSTKTRRTRILFVTEGLLLRQIIGDPGLDR
jgi:hypothetical protein